jgi:hypothetical protein
LAGGYHEAPLEMMFIIYIIISNISMLTLQSFCNSANYASAAAAGPQMTGENKLGAHDAPGNDMLEGFGGHPT